MGNLDSFLEKATKIHQNLFDYSGVKDECLSSKITLCCKEHGWFDVFPRTHLKSKTGGCPKCRDTTRMTTNTLSDEDAINSLKKTHGDKYDYSKFKYNGQMGKSTITCNLHGDFKMRYIYHKQGQLCPKCSKEVIKQNYRHDPTPFLERVNKIHKNKYDYSKMEYAGHKKKIKIICKNHGPFFMTPNYHQRGFGCSECLKEDKRKDLINCFKKVHGNRFDYSLMKYESYGEPITVICKDHGQFKILPDCHKKGYHCKECTKIEKREKTAKTTSQVVEEFKSIHGDKFDYSLVEYINSRTKVKIICKKHGVFETYARTHMISKSVGCPKCCGKTLTNEERIKILKEIFDEENYDYSKFNYNGHEKVTIICPEHGEFKKQYTHMTHYYQGCPACKNSSKGEREVRLWLKKNKIKFEEQKIFEECKNKFALRFDFYLPNNNTLIEYQGKQHYEPIEAWGGEEALAYRKQNDKIKKDFSNKMGIKLICIKYNESAKDRLQEEFYKAIGGSDI